MNLKDTIEMMTSEDYKERFKAEYHQLDTRIKGLSKMLEGYRAGTLPFTPKCTIKLLDAQMNAMIIYRTHLVERARLEDVNLDIEEVKVEDEE